MFKVEEEIAIKVYTKYKIFLNLKKYTLYKVCYQDKPTHTFEQTYSMKKIITFITALLLLSNFSFAQNDNKELPAITASNADAFFIPDAICKKFNVTKAQGDAWMKVYNNVQENVK